MLLAVGASQLLPPATNYFLLAFGGALFGASLAAPATTVIRETRQVVQQAPTIEPQALYIPRMKPRGAYGAFIAVSMALGASLLILYPWLTHTNSPRLQATSGGAPVKDTLGRALPPTVDPQLHVVSLGERFVLSRAQITVQAARVCRSGGEEQVDVPAAITALRQGEVISEPEYQLLDSGGVPHQPAQTVQLDAPRARDGHAAPPPSVYRESINFKVPLASAKGALKLQAVLPTGTGPEYRVTVAGQSGSRSSATEDVPTTCISPGGQGV
jgi:hypothetical protein